ncbi:MAG: efflux RND transporter periplasmic adaptor subunit [Flavobacteriales bacterium]|nr:efflux RND transporter periplasmic adaptor subunit [Flavobacteriales bacterium]
MLKIPGILFISLWLLSCNEEVNKTRPVLGPITESIYASGVVKSKNQYQAFATVNGIIDEIFVSEGDTVEAGAPILSIYNEVQRLNKENAELSAAYSDISANQEKLKEAQLVVDFARNKMLNDSLMFARQKSLWQQGIGSKTELEQKDLAYQNASNAYYSAVVKFKDLKRQLNLASSQSKKNLQISNELSGEYIIRSEIDGVVYGINLEKGELVGPQTPLCVIGDAREYVLEMFVDEYDIFRIQKAMQVEVVLDSYKGQVFSARITKINPLMNERNKTFLVEAEFTEKPVQLFPNVSFEANIVVAVKENALLIPRNYLLNDSLVITSSGDTVVVQTGLKDYKKAEILSGISAGDELIEPQR